VFRVVTYNIRAGLGIDGVRSIRRIADVLAGLSPDVACLQEVDQHVPRSWLANQPKFLSTRLGAQAVFQRNISFGAGGFGNCVLAKPIAPHCRYHALPGAGEPRGVLEATASVDGREVTVFCTHLSTEEPVRVEQAQRVRDIVRAAEGPKLLCGDMNDVLGSQTLAILLEDPVLRDAALEMDAGDTPTFSADDSRRIDFVLADLRFDVKAYEVVESEASDHGPVVVDLEFA
jgi:endonuclease/exonuclease/phosphatase family metal-dependent hydrolase